MKHTAKLAKSIAPADNESKIQALTTLLLRAKTQDERSVLIEALAEANNMNIVVGDAHKTPVRSHDRCLTLSPYKSNGARKATAAEPIRNQDDFRAIGNYLLTHGNERNRQRNYTLYICGITLGLRVGDLLNLTIGDVYDLAGASVRGHLQIINQKTHKRTTDLITPMAANAITDLVNEIRTAQSGVLDASWPLFQSQKWCRAGGMTKKLSKSQVYRFLTEAAEACEVQGHISTHSMRKTYGYAANSTLSQNGVPAAQIMETLQAKFRHSDQTTTMRYIGLQQEQIDATALSVDVALSGANF